MNTVTKLELIKQARSLISDKDNWIKGASAIDGNRYVITPGLPAARQWCAIGALRHVTYNQGGKVVLDELEADMVEVLGEMFGGNDVVYVNDYMGHGTVM